MRVMGLECETQDLEQMRETGSGFETQDLGQSQGLAITTNLPKTRN